MRCADWLGGHMRLCFFCMVLAAWYLLAAVGKVPGMLFMLELTWELLTEGDAVYGLNLLEMLFTSLKILMAACLLAMLTAIPLGLFMGYFQRLGSIADIYIEIMRPIPPLAWIPLGYSIFSGLSEPTVYVQVLVVYAGAFFPLLTSAVYGVKSVDCLLVDAAYTLGAKSSWQQLRLVVLPSALPSIMGGIRSSLGVGWMCIVGAEFVGGKLGIGAYIWGMYTLGGRLPEILIAVLFTGITGFAMNRLVSMVERRLLAWY